MAKYNIYAVAYGLHPETKAPVNNLKFHTWDECKPYVVGIEGAKYKGFLTDAEADEWLAKTAATPFEKQVKTLRPTAEQEMRGSFTMDVENMQKVQETLEEQYQRNPKDSFFHPEFYQMCTDMGLVPFGVLMMLQKQFVAEQKHLQVMKQSTAALKNGLPFI